MSEAPRSSSTARPPSVAMVLPDAESRRLADDLGIPIVADKEDVDVALCVLGDALHLVDRRRPRAKPLGIDFVAALEAVRSLPASRRGVFPQALGRKTVTVIDATAGWGRDTWLMCLMGYRVTAMERSPVMGALLLDAGRRLRRRAPDLVPEILVGDARHLMKTRSADCIYLDPMFPPKPKRSALTRRPLSLLREIVGDDADFGSLFATARRAARKRVVVKRPSHSPVLMENPSHSFCGKMVSYDVYLKGQP